MRTNWVKNYIGGGWGVWSMNWFQISKVVGDNYSIWLKDCVGLRVFHWRKSYNGDEVRRAW